MQRLRANNFHKHFDCIFGYFAANGCMVFLLLLLMLTFSTQCQINQSKRKGVTLDAFATESTTALNVLLSTINRAILHKYYKALLSILSNKNKYEKQFAIELTFSSESPTLHNSLFD